MNRKWICNAFLVVVLGLILVDALPRTSLAHARLKQFVDPVLDATGLWQESWQLFAPEPDRANVALSARIHFEGGVVRTWRSPDWRQMSLTERFLAFRDAEFIDRIHRPENRSAWPAFADYLAASVEDPGDPGARPIRIELVRHRVVVPDPELRQPFLARLEPAPDFVFYARDYR